MGPIRAIAVLMEVSWRLVIICSIVSNFLAIRDSQCHKFGMARFSEHELVSKDQDLIRFDIIMDGYEAII